MPHASEAVQGYTPGYVLSWKGSQHWMDGKTRSCVHCKKKTFLRDETGRPSHKVCAEIAYLSLSAAA